MAALPFVTPWIFGAGAMATAIPIVIHLLNRRRFRVRPWAAMAFLLAAYRRNIRRLQMQRWLLLLLRCLALLLLAAAVADFIPPGAALSTLVGGRRRLTVVVWNDAYPMAYRPAGAPSVFARSRRLLEQWLATAGGNQRVAILRGSSYTAPLVNWPTRDLAAAGQLVRRQRVTQAAVNLPGGLRSALRLLRRARRRLGRLRVWVLTDCAAADFGLAGTSAGGRTPSSGLIPDRSTAWHHTVSPAPDPQADAKKPEFTGRAGSVPRRSIPAGATVRLMGRLIRAIRKLGAKVKVIDVGDPHAATLAVTALQTVRPVVLTGRRVDLRISVLNATAAPQAEVVVHLLLDHVPAGSATIPRLNPGETVTVRVPLDRMIPTPGAHAIEARLLTAALPVAGIRRLAVHAVRQVRLLLVDGQGSGGEGIGEFAAPVGLIWLRAALAPRRHGNAFHPSLIRALPLADVSLRRYRGVILSDTEAPGAALVGRLRRYVRSGGLLMIFPGPGFDSARWNQALGVGGANLAPALWGQVATAAPPRTDGQGVVHFDLHSSINFLTAPFIAAAQSGIPTGLDRISTWRYIRLNVLPPATAEVLLRFTNGWPAVVRRRVGRGTVIAWASTCDTQWNDFPVQPSWLPMIHTLLYHSLADRNGGRNLLVGSGINRAGTSPAGIWSGPGGMAVPVRVRSEAGAMRLVSGPLWQAGFYRPVGSDLFPENPQPLQTTRITPAAPRSGAAQRRGAVGAGSEDWAAPAERGGGALVAVNINPADADIRHVPPARVAEELGLPSQDIVEHPRTLGGLTATGAGGAIGYWLLWPALLILLVEALVARAFSHYRYGQQAATPGPRPQ